MSTDPAVPAAARRILVVEDEMMIAMLMEDMLVDIGHHVVAVAQNLRVALQLAEGGDFDLAILDVNLAGERSFPVAELLTRRGVPFMFATGYGAMGLDEAFRDTLTLNKPFQIEDLAEAVDKVAAAA